MNETTIGAWKDPDFRKTLNADQLAAIPSHPSGTTWAGLDESQVRQIVGGVADSDANPQAESGGYICTLTTETCFCCPP